MQNAKTVIYVIYQNRIIPEIQEQFASNVSQPYYVDARPHFCSVDAREDPSPACLHVMEYVMSTKLVPLTFSPNKDLYSTAAKHRETILMLKDFIAIGEYDVRFLNSKPSDEA